MCLLTGAGKQIPPVTDAQHLFGLFSLFCSVFIIAYLIGNVASILANLHIERSLFNKEKRFVLDYLKHRKMPDDLHQRVVSVFDQKWNSQQGSDPNAVLAQLPRYDQVATIVILRL